MPILLLTVSGVLTIAGFLSQYGWWFDLASHFQLQYLAIQLLCILLCIPKKRWKLLGITSLFALINLALIIPLYIPHSATPPIDDRNTNLSVLLINLNSSNEEYSKTARYIKQTNPDILALEEINNEWLEALSDVLKDYPYTKVIPRRDNFGIGLYSKLKTQEMDIKYFGTAEVPSVLARYSISGKPLTLLFTHPVPPGSLRYYQWRNEQLKDIASQRSSFDDRLILIGDLNSTSWSYHFQTFVKNMKLIDSRKGFGLQTTWPTMLPVMAITIDHVLISEDLKILEHKIGPHIGSDHKPVFARIGL